MKTLLLLRHAKSTWDHAGPRDHDRPLNPRGERAAPRMGQLMCDEGLVPDVIIASTAVRARQTADLLVASIGLDPAAVVVCEDLYLAAPGGIVDVVRRRGGDAARVLVVAHNPGLENLVEKFAGRHEPLPTAALAVFRVDVDGWDDLALMTPAELAALWRPKELDDGSV